MATPVIFQVQLHQQLRRHTQRQEKNGGQQICLHHRHHQHPLPPGRGWYRCVVVQRELPGAGDHSRDLGGIIRVVGSHGLLLTIHQVTFQSSR